MQNHNLKRKNSESEEDQKRKGHLPEPERGQEHQAEEAGGRGPVSELSAASPATPRHGGPSIPPGTAFQAPHCAQTGTPRCPTATTRDWPPGTMIGGWGRQLKKQGKDCVQPWPESNIPETNCKSKSKQNPAIEHRGEEHEGPCPQRHQGYLLHHEVSSEKVRNYQQLPHSHPHAYF